VASRLKAPFPWFGGKSQAASLVWDRLGNPPNFVEPFAGSLAVLLNRPGPPGTETVNDIDCYVANAWRAIQADPGAVAEWCDWPVNEADLSARHLWLVNRDEFRERMKVDPDHFDPKVAGWWLWGQSLWIGSGWCRNAGMGVHRQLPHVGDAGRGAELLAYMEALACRLRRVRVCCGEWDRVLGPSVTFRHGVTGVLLDPPYPDEANRQDDLYACDDGQVAHAVREWAIANGDNPELRIALCGYEGQHEMPATWECVPWKAKGGYSSQNRDGNENPKRERIWFSPHCLADAATPLFRDEDAHA
jgi:DNA adenine methylase